MIELKDVSVDIVVHTADSLSLRKKIFRKAPNATIINVLKNINLTVSEHERIGLWGRNGSGKTSLLRCLAGAYHPTSGTRRVNGRIGSLIDIGLGIDQEATGLENIYLKLGVENYRLKSDKHLVQEIIKFSGLGERIHLPVRTYSTGMAMRLAFSIVSHLPADILLMDEWLSVGDKEFNFVAAERLKIMIDRSKALVIASHDRGLLESVCTKIINMEKGEIVESSPY
jgi:lipopolysaccharide transport system ATP-binding protein